VIFPILLFLFWIPICLDSRCMATAQTLPLPPTEPGVGPTAGADAEKRTEKATVAQALVPAPPSLEPAEALALTPKVARLPVELDVSVPVRNFRVRNLLALEPSHLIESGWGHGEDVPLAAGVVQLAWTEFEVIDTLLAVRVTRLA
jgi:hypothetical protein